MSRFCTSRLGDVGAQSANFATISRLLKPEDPRYLAEGQNAHQAVPSNPRSQTKIVSVYYGHMRTIGLIGGMSFESSAVYYRLLNESVRARLGALHSAQIILYSVDFQEIVDLQTAGRWSGAGLHLAAVASRLEQAGADCILICTNTMHLVADTVQQAVNVPLIHIIDETAQALLRAGRKKPLLLGTRYTMEQAFYRDRIEAHGLDLIVPNEADRTTVHDIIFTELCSGLILPASRAHLIAIVDQAKRSGADAVILGCTELSLILNPNDLPIPGFDSTAIHCEAAVNFSLNE